MRLIDADAIDECKELMTDIKGDTVYAVKMSDIRELPTVCDIEQIKAEIYEEFMTIDGGVHDGSAIKCMQIIDKYM